MTTYSVGCPSPVHFLHFRKQTSTYLPFMPHHLLCSQMFAENTEGRVATNPLSYMTIYLNLLLAQYHSHHYFCHPHIIWSPMPSFRSPFVSIPSFHFFNFSINSSILSAISSKSSVYNNFHGHPDLNSHHYEQQRFDDWRLMNTNLDHKLFTKPLTLTPLLALFLHCYK